MSNITLNIVEPASPTPAPVDPGIDPSVPNTGLFTHGIGGTEATVITIVSVVLILTIVAIVLAVLYKKHKKQGKTTKLVHVVESRKAIVSNKKRVTAGLMAIAILVSAGTFVALAKNGVNASEGDEQSQTEGTNDSSLTVDVSDQELTIEVGDAPVFAVLPVEVSVEEATAAGYTLTAYTDSTDLVSTTDESNTIPMIAVEGDELEALTDNTYGLALGNGPTTKDEEVYTVLSTDQSNPTIIKSMTEYTPTAENDTTTIYYGFYITPNTPYGTYEGSNIHYNATINTTLVTFDGNDLYFNEDTSQTTNEVEYIAVPQEESEGTINQIISGEYLEPAQSLPYNFLGWSEEQEATTPTYTSAEDIAQNLPILPNQPIILYAIWQKATTITFDANDGTGDKTTQTIIAGESDNLNPNEFTREGYTFNGWNTDAEGEGKSYADKELYQAEAESANITLFAQWKKNILYMQKVSEWGSSLSKGNEITVVDSRDGKEYTVARLADNKIWMTKNLNLAGGTEITSELSNVPDNYTLPTANGFEEGNKLPASSTSGFNDNTKAFVYNSTTTSGTDCSSPGCYSYYSWTAATAGSGLSIADDNTDASYSICPKGWKLPSSRTSSVADWKTESDFYQLAVAYGMNSSYTYESASNFFNQAGPGTTPNFLLTGYYYYGSFNNGGSYGSYWSSTSSTSAEALSLYLGSSDVRSANNNERRRGNAVRCIAE